MRIRVSDIGPSGLSASGTISLEALNARMAEGRGNDIVFQSDPKIEITVYQTLGGAQTSGKISTRYKQPCSRCIIERERELEVEANFIFRRRSLDETTSYMGSVDTHYDDLGVYYFTGEHIELEEIVQEALIISLSQFWHPPELPDGRCSLCQVSPLSFNAKTEKQAKASLSLKALLRDAGVG